MAVTRRHPLFASEAALLFIVHYMRAQDLKAAIEAAVTGMSHIVAETAATGSDELKIIDKRRGQRRWLGKQQRQSGVKA